MHFCFYEGTILWGVVDNVHLKDYNLILYFGPNCLLSFISVCTQCHSKVSEWTSNETDNEIMRLSTRGCVDLPPWDKVPHPLCVLTPWSHHFPSGSGTEPRGRLKASHLPILNMPWKPLLTIHFQLKFFLKMSFTISKMEGIWIQKKQNKHFVSF